MRLYRIDQTAPARYNIKIAELLHDGVLVPVERCEHGNHDKHFVKNPYSTITGSWCPGAGIGGDE
jgi:hypothetical protein